MAEATLSKQQQNQQRCYAYWRWRIFYSIYIGYAVYYLNRRSFPCIGPQMLQSLQLPRTLFGTLNTVLAITYGISKLLSGMLGDRLNPRYLMASGLLLAGLSNICFGLCSSFFGFVLFWGLNGCFQGWGWPPCARLLTHWYAKKERGFWWAVWNSCHSLAGALIPLLVSCSNRGQQWRYLFCWVGMLALLVGLLLLDRLRDTPQSLGLPPIEPASAAADAASLAKKGLLLSVLSNRYIWLLASACFFLCVVRHGVMDLALLYLIEKGFSPPAASYCIPCFESGGLLGSLVAGWSSDYFFGGRRGPVNLVFCGGLLAAVLTLWILPEGALLLHLATLFAIGFLTLGPHMLLGMAAAELTDKRAAGTSTGVVGFISCLGVACSGYPLIVAIERWNWAAFFYIHLCCSGLTLLLLLPFYADDRNPQPA